MKATVVVFPFDQFGSGGTGEGARLLADAVWEVIDDTAAETRPSRADSLRGKLKVRDVPFETLDEIAGWRERGREAARRVLKSREFLVWLGGNHLSCLPVLEELTADTLVVQFDAHLDVYAFHDNTAALNHGNFVKELRGRRVVNVGHRDLFITDADTAESFDAVFPATEIALDIEKVAAELRAKCEGAKRVWIDLDCDAFDPAFLPGVRQPLPFGLTPPAFLKLLDAAWSDKVVGFSISEFDPAADVRDTSLQLLGWLLEFVLLKVAGRGKP